MWRVLLGNPLCDLDPNVIFFIVNASHPKLFEVAALYFAAA